MVFDKLLNWNVSSGSYCVNREWKIFRFIIVIIFDSFARQVVHKWKVLDNQQIDRAMPFNFKHLIDERRAKFIPQTFFSSIIHQKRAYEAKFLSLSLSSAFERFNNVK